MAGPGIQELGGFVMNRALPEFCGIQPLAIPIDQVIMRICDQIAGALVPGLGNEQSIDYEQRLQSGRRWYPCALSFRQALMGKCSRNQAGMALQSANCHDTQRQPFRRFFLY